MDLHQPNIAHFMTETLSMRRKSSDHIILPTFEKDLSSNLALPFQKEILRPCTLDLRKISWWLIPRRLSNMRCFSKKVWYAPVRWICVVHFNGCNRDGSEEGCGWKWLKTLWTWWISSDTKWCDPKDRSNKLQSFNRAREQNLTHTTLLFGFF